MKLRLDEIRGVSSRGLVRLSGVSAALTLALAACSTHDAQRTVLGPPPVLPAPQRIVRAKGPPEWFWEAIEPVLKPNKPAALVSTEGVVRTEGAARLWDELGTDGQERLRRDGVVVLGSRAYARARMGAFYTELREQRMPYVLTLDALFYAAHVVLERALAEVEDTSVVPALDALLTGLTERLASGNKGTDTEVAEGAKLARGVVAVAAALDGLGAPPDDLAGVVAAEVAAVDAHAGLAQSRLLGVPIDYARFAPPSGAARPSAYKALAWLATAPLALVARAEMRGAVVDVARARTHARAAMILARLVDRDVGDPALRVLHGRLVKLLSFVWGPSDDLSLGDVADAAEAVLVDLGKPDHIADVVKVDRVRHRASKLRAPHLFDGAGVPGDAGANVRVLGGAAPPDSVTLAWLAAPAVASRSLPTTLDVAVWLGGSEARSCLHDDGADGAAGLQEGFTRAAAIRPTHDSIHASVHGSMLDAIGAWLSIRGPSASAERASIESALAAWTWLRHDGNALSRGKPVAAASSSVLLVPGGPLPAFVEAAPVVIARLLSTVRQIERGLTVLGPMKSSSPALVSVAEVADLLNVALRVATREVNDEPLADADVAALASFPARLARVETEAAAQVPVAADVYTDLRSGRALTSATGLVERAVFLVREPGTGRPEVAVGAHVAQHEIVDPVGARTTDASVRGRLDVGLARARYAQVFLMVP